MVLGVLKLGNKVFKELWNQDNKYKDMDFSISIGKS